MFEVKSKPVSVERDPYDLDVWYVTYRGLQVGIIRQTENVKIYITRRDFGTHYFRKFNGYGISTSVLKELKRRGVKKILIIEKSDEGELVLSSDINDWFNLGKEYVNKFPDGSKDHQLVLPRLYMDIIS